MSFSSEVKEELSKISNLSNKNAVKMELFGYFLTSNVVIHKNNISFSTESEYNINRFSKILNNLDILDYSIEIQGKVFKISFNIKNISKIFQIKNEEIKKNEIPKEENLKKSIVRGAFLGGGSINNPENKYHAEIIFRGINEASIVKTILMQYEINFKILEMPNKISLYSKEGETISKLLAFIEANSAILRFEEIRVVRDMRNNVNRTVNCETANLNKTINAAVKQIEDIKLLKRYHKFEILSDNLKEIANLRIENPEASLQELGKMLENPVGKSGVNHRLKTISALAEEIRKLKKENNNV